MTCAWICGEAIGCVGWFRVGKAGKVAAALRGLDLGPDDFLCITRYPTNNAIIGTPIIATINTFEELEVGSKASPCRLIRFSELMMSSPSIHNLISASGFEFGSISNSRVADSPG